MKLTETKVHKARNMRAKGISQRRTAKELHVHHSTISDIDNGITWNPVRKEKAKLIQQKAVRGENSHWAKLNEKLVREILWYLKQGYTQSYLARKYNVSPQLISLINTGKIWRHVKI